MHQLLIAFSLLPFYLIGSFPTGYLIAKAHGIEITGFGSGNVGATNVLRALGKKAGALTLVGDVLKGYLSLFLAELLNGTFHYSCLAAIAVVAGHCFSIPPKLKGGKGVATALGVLLFLTPKSALFALAVFILVLKIWKLVSLASICAVMGTPVFSMLMAEPDDLSYALTAIAAVIIFRHRSNLLRLAQGKESRIEAKI